MPPFRVDNATIPSRWVSDYQLDGRPQDRTFVALVHFGPGFSADHIEVCAAATYGVLLQGEKHWELRRGDDTEVIRIVQHRGDTVYVPPGWVHNVTTVSDGAIIIGETKVVAGSARGLTRVATALHSTLRDPQRTPVQEAEDLCALLGVSITAKKRRRGGTGASAPAFQALEEAAARTAGGSRARQKDGRRKRKKLFGRKARG
ncbi:hypothetical protein P43SY_011537 [Pythium insidiosum]|uniref:JmjC domain-containing protein n=1 Tax=Pythium insidiosum TaxID=114742 RepID=A0AAD5M0E5_PYTIN|nr:hypothetical protein P43SY_011537 [Pythium insidiosum]